MSFFIFFNSKLKHTPPPRSRPKSTPKVYSTVTFGWQDNGTLIAVTESRTARFPEDASKLERLLVAGWRMRTDWLHFLVCEKQVRPV